MEEPQPILARDDDLGVTAHGGRDRSDRLEDCVAIEDSDTGTRSAEAAGCPVLVVPSHVAVEDGPGRHVVPGFEAWDLGALRVLGDRADTWVDRLV